MAFLNATDMLVLEKDGNIRRVTNGILVEKPVLQIKVQTESERGLLGIAATGKDVYLYLTEVSGSDGSVRNRIQVSLEWRKTDKSFSDFGSSRAARSESQWRKIID